MPLPAVLQNAHATVRRALARWAQRGPARALVYVVGFLLLLGIEGVTLSWLWAWFVMPRIGGASLPVGQAMGVLLVAKTINRPFRETADSDVQVLMKGLRSTLLLLLAGLLIHLLLPMAGRPA